MNDVTVIDRFLNTFSTYIDSGFGLLQGEVAFLTATLIVIDMIKAFTNPDMMLGANLDREIAAINPLLALAHVLWHRLGQRRAAAALLALTLWQVASGLSNVVLGWPLLAALGHSAGAAALVAGLSSLLARTARARPAS